MIRRSTISSAMLCLLLAGACTAAAQRDEPQPEQSQQDGTELVEITIRLPDGRVIKRKEPRIASRVDGDVPVLSGDRPPVVATKSKNASKGDVEIINGGVTGGSNSASTSTGGASGGGGGGGGGGGSSARSGGGGSNGTTTPPSGGHSGGNSDDDTVVPVQPDTDPTVRFYAWDNSGTPFQHIQEAVVVDARGRTPQQLANRVAQQLRQQDADKVVLRFWKEFAPATREPFDISNPRELIESGGFDAGLSEYWSAFAHELAAQGVRPDYMIFDQEDGVGFWNIPQSQRRAFFADLLNPSRPISNELPVSMRGVSVEDFMNYRSSAGRDAFSDYNQYATEFRAKYLRRIFHAAFERAYGVNIPTSNYRDLIIGFPVFFYTGRTAEVASVAGVSAPVTYLDFRNVGGVRYHNTQKDQRWNRLIDKLNAVRSTAQPGLTTPWVAPPGYGRNGPDTWARASELDKEKALWNELMQHMLAMGVDTFILWNPGTQFNPNAVAVDDWMDDWLGQHPQVNTPQLRSLPIIPLDADRIETNGYVTTYEQYLQFMELAE